MSGLPARVDLCARAEVGMQEIRELQQITEQCLLLLTGNQLIALDFDGVVCDSCGESSLSAFKV